MNTAEDLEPTSFLDAEEEQKEPVVVEEPKAEPAVVEEPKVESTPVTEKVVAEVKPAVESKPVTAPATTPAATTTQCTRSVRGKMYPIALAPDEQKPIKELSLCDIIMWRNYFITLPLFLSIHALFILLNKYEFSVITLVGRVVLIQVILSFLYIVVFKILQNNSRLVLL